MGASLYSKGVLKVINSIRGDHVSVIPPRGPSVAYGIQKLDSSEILSKKQGLAVQILDSIYSMPNLRELAVYREGLLFDQSYPSITVGHILEPKPGERILDMCAAPGGKTTHIAQLMNNKGVIIACDRSSNRLKTLQENVQRLGIENVRIMNIDSRLLPEKYNMKFDKIILDPPCTSLGHRPKLYDTVEIQSSIAISEYQIQLIKSASKLIKPGGLIAYSTCTIPYYENELVVKFACEKLGFKIQEPIFNPASEGELAEVYSDLSMCVRFYPDIQDTPGFFIALLKKIN